MSLSGVYSNIPSRDEEDRRRNESPRSAETTPIIRRSEDEEDGPLGRSIRALQEAPLNESQAVRLNVAQTVAAPASDTRRSQSLLVYIQTLFQLPPAIAALVIVPMSYQKGESCNQPLGFWAVIYALTLLMSLWSVWMSYIEPTEVPEEMSTFRRYAESIKKPLESFSLGWLIIGQVWVQSAEPCGVTSPALFTLCFWLVFVGFIYFLLPCIVIILALPFLCFCLPCVIRLLARVAGAEQFRGKGASEQVINSIVSKKFHPGLFEDEADPQCSICLSSYEEQQDLRILPCDGRHHFHKECVDEWLRVNGSCPICRASVIDANDGSSGASAEQQQDQRPIQNNNSFGENLV